MSTAMSATASRTAARVGELAAELERERSGRLRRTALDRADFDALAGAGYLLTGVPVEQGGLFSTPGASLRGTSEMLRALGRADPSLALVCAMHPGVLGFWLTERDAPPAEYAAAWARQCESLFGHALDGCWFGTIASEPGAGGDLGATRTVAAPDAGGGYRLTGDKFMGSGSGVTSFMLATAVPVGESGPDLFMLDTRGVPWDGSTGVTLVREWDGLGMAATQSHAFRFEGAWAERSAWPHRIESVAPRALTTVVGTFTAVAIGILDAAVDAARELIARRGRSLRSLEQTEWVMATNEHWLALQAYEGSLRAAEAGTGQPVAAFRAKLAVATLGEQILTRLSRALGGVSLSRGAPFAQWSQDIKALGHLRPPWSLAVEQLAAAEAPER